ncbi:CdaR family protein [Gracilibacillus dipsosauri]
MNKWLDKPWMIRIVSLLLAVLLFVVVAFDENVYDDNDGFDSYFGTTNETQTLEDIPVRIILDEEEYVVGGVPETVKVTLQGSASKVTSIATRKNFDVFVDLEGLGTGTHTVPLEYSGIDEDLNVYVEPKEVEVSIEERATEEFSVNIDVVNKDQIEAGYEVVNVSSDP